MLSIVEFFFKFQAFDRIKSYIDYAKASPDHKIIAGGNCDKT